MKFNKKIKKRYLIGALLVIVAIIAGVVFAKKSNELSRYVVGSADVSDELILAGIINAEDRVDLGFASSGRVKSVNVKEGERVQKGQIIAEIEQNRLAADLNQAQANLNFVQADVQAEQEQSRVETSLLTKAARLQEQNKVVETAYQNLLNNDLQAYPTGTENRNVEAPDISGSYQADEQGEYMLEMYNSGSRSGYSFRLSGLESGTYTAENYAPGKLGERGLFVTFGEESNYGNTDWVVPIPNTRSTTYRAVKNAYDTAVATRARIEAESETSIVENAVAANASDEREAARRAQARAQVNAVAAQLGDGKIRAPYSGIVGRNDLVVGDIVSGFTPYVTMFKDEEKILELSVPEIYINRVEENNEVAISLDAYPDEEFTGTVTSIAIVDTEVDGVPVYETDVRIDTNDSRIRIGMNAKAKIVAEEVTDVIAIPKHYIQEKSDSVFVLVETQERPQKYEQRIITTGFTGNNGLIEVTEGLSVGDVILLEKE